MTHQGPEAALDKGCSAQGWEQEMLLGTAQQEELFGPFFPRAAPAQVSAWGRAEVAEVAQDGERRMSRRKGTTGV